MEKRQKIVLVFPAIPWLDDTNVAPPLSLIYTEMVSSLSWGRRLVASIYSRILALRIDRNFYSHLFELSLLKAFLKLRKSTL